MIDMLLFHLIKDTRGHIDQRLVCTCLIEKKEKKLC